MSLIKMSCKISGWWNGWRNHNFSELQLNMWRCSPGTGRELSFHEWEVSREALQWPRSWWERTGRLMRFWTDKQLLWKTCPTEASLPLSLMLQPQVALCLDPQTSKELPGWKCKVLKNPNHSFSQSTDHCSAHIRPLWPKYDFIATTNCFHLFRFLKGHQAENPQPPTAVVCNVQSCGSCLHCTVTDKFNS